MGTTIKKPTTTTNTVTNKKSKPTTTPSKTTTPTERLGFVYPYGVTINIQKPSRALLSSSSSSYPMNRPIASYWEAETVVESGGQRGRIVVIGSVDMLSDEWIDKEENTKLSDLIFAWLLSEYEFDMTSNRQDSELVQDVQHAVPIPNIEALGQSLKPCLQGLEELPHDFTKLFDYSMFGFDVHLIPEAIKLYETLG